MTSARKATTSTLLQLRIDLLDVQPAVWRRVIVPASISLPQLHRVMQIIMGWQDYHLHEFCFDSVSYGVPDPDGPDDPPLLDEKRVKLERVLGTRSSFNYLYDFGDGWEHRVKVEKRLPANPDMRWPRCTSGRNACPPEDVGGPGGYTDLLRAIEDPADKSYATKHEWIGSAFDPTSFDLILTNQNLVEVRL
jgi:hypothetical protein